MMHSLSNTATEIYCSPVLFELSKIKLGYVF